MPNSDKTMEILVADFKVQAETGPLMALAGFTTPDESVEPPKPVIEVILSPEEIQEREFAF